MANGNGGGIDHIKQKPSVNVIVSNPLTRMLAEQLKRADRVLRVADERWSQGAMSDSDYEQVREEAMRLCNDVKSRIGELDKFVRSSRRRSRSGKAKTKANGRARPAAKGNGQATSKSSGESAKPASAPQEPSGAKESDAVAAANADGVAAGSPQF